MNRIEHQAKIAADALLGQAVGDAFGVPVEFLSRKEVQTIDLREMTGMEDSPPFDSRWSARIPKGAWSDDTSMALASMASIIRNHGKIDPDDQIKQFIHWWNDGAYCCLDFPFGLGRTVGDAMQRYQLGAPPLLCGGPYLRDNGNGALMRILPFSLYCIFHGLSPEATVKVISDASSLTHRHEISKMSCFVWTEFLRQLALSASAADAAMYAESLPYAQWFSPDTLSALSFVSQKRLGDITEDHIGETGYVVDTLYAAFFSVLHSADFEQAVYTAVHLGYDTDTAGAVTGMAAGILYGADHIPDRWMHSLRKKDELAQTARDFVLALNG